MPSILNPASGDAHSLRSRIAVLVCTFLLDGIAVLGLAKVAPGDSGQTHVVLMEGMMFAPSSLRIQPGDRVTFRNADLVPHTATARSGKLFDSGAIKPGESWTMTPPAGQTIRYVCTYHPMMEGEIIADKP
jgi:plastocyanin